MEEEQEKQNETPRQGTIGPGERLQAARIQKGLSVEDVASRMHLSNNILEAIEDNNFDEITAPIFVKGYLRAYARIVNLSEDDMIEQYLDLYSEEDPPISSTSNMVPELSSTDTRIRWTTYFVVILLAILLAAWWWNKQQNPVPPVSLDVPSASETETAADDAVVDSDIQAGSELVIEETVVEIEASPQDTAVMVVEEPATATPEPSETVAVEAVLFDADSAEAEVAQEEAAETLELAASESAEAEPVAEAETMETGVTPTQADTSASGAQAEEAPVAVAGTRELPTAEAPIGSDKLRIVVHADTWADVKDANNYQLTYDLLRANNTMELSGQAPFVVFLGNGHGVEIEFNGEPVEFSTRIRDDNTARINVGG